MGSSRLPGKILKPLGETDVLSYVTKRCKKIKKIEEVIVGTSTLPQDDAVENWCKENGIACFRGSEEDVLDRFVECAKQYQPDYVMRVTADCPFVDYLMADEMMSLLEKERTDIVLLNGSLPRGLAVELISYEALLYIHAYGKEHRHREHVTYYAYEYKEKFSSSVYNIPNSYQYPKLRITLDTEEDYLVISKTAHHFNELLVPSLDVIQFLLDHPEIAKINADIEQKPVI
jgi:spore coat polysaccharide biosynthesis protein SpsF